MDHTRHMAIFNASHLTVSLIGAGGIGSMTGVVLAKMGVASVEIFDFDRVSDENVPTQFYGLPDIGKNKARALAEWMARLGDAGETEIGWIPDRVDLNHLVMANVVISAVDSILARQEIFSSLRCNWYLDARMAAEEFHLYSIPLGAPEIAGRYWEELSSLCDADVPDEPCTSKATIYTAAIAAGHIGNAVRQIAAGEAPSQYLYHNIRTGTLVKGDLYGPDA